MTSLRSSRTCSWALCTVGLIALACGQASQEGMEKSRNPPDGSRTGTILFVRLSGSNFHSDSGAELLLMRSDATAQRQLTKNAAHDAYPAWSPDCRQIAFASDRDHPDLRGRQMTRANGELGPQMAMEVYVMRVDGTGSARLTNDTVPSFVGQQAWAPDGQQLLMDSWHDGDSEILIVRPDGTTMRQLTDNDAWDGSAAWSPDGQHIVFRSDRSGEGALYLMRPTGDSLVRLTPVGERAALPVWSPDGTQIAYTFLRYNQQDIGVINADGSAPRRLTADSAQDRWPSWSPDGRQIAFVSTRDGEAEVYVMNADGSAPRRLTTNPTGDEMPTWVPEASKCHQ